MLRCATAPTWDSRGFGESGGTVEVDSKLGNQVTPIAIKLDGLPHSVSRSLEGVAASIEPGARYTLQITGGSSVYGPVRSAGTVALGHIRLSMPSVRR